MAETQTASAAANDGKKWVYLFERRRRQVA